MGVSILTLAVSVTLLLRPKASGPNVLLIVLDTTRPDRLSLYGYERSTTPNLEKLAAESTVYTQAYSTSSWTPPSHASLFTGLLPCFHGVTQESSPIPALPSKFLTLAEALWESGYRTSGLIGNPMLHKRTGFAQGFEEYHETWPLRDRDGRHPAEHLLQAVLDRESDRPFFVFVNLIEPHSPYDSSREYFGIYDRHPEIELVNYHWAQHLVGRMAGEAELEHLGDLYDSEIQYVDTVVGRIVELLADRQALDSTLLVITADHGEHFGEHGLVGHIFNLYETNVRVPLIIRYPELVTPGVRNDHYAQLHDLFETILFAAGSGDRYRSQGINLLVDSLPNTRAVFFEYYFPLFELRNIHHGVPSGLQEEYERSPRLASFKRRLRAVRRGRLKYILGSDGRAELYDLVDDPLELEDLAPHARSSKLSFRTCGAYSSRCSSTVRNCPLRSRAASNWMRRPSGS